MNEIKKEIIACHDLRKSFAVGGKRLEVLRGISLTVQAGDFIAITGRSGAGKSTLLYQLSLLDQPSSGTVFVGSINAGSLSEPERTAIRLSQFGYVFQSYALVPELTAAENVMAPAIMRGLGHGEAKTQATAALNSVGLGERVNNLPSMLSGGEQQRVAIARAIALPTSQQPTSMQPPRVPSWTYLPLCTEPVKPS